MPRPLPLAFLLFFAGMWIGISYLLARISGWRALAERSPAGEEPPGERILWASAQFGTVSFRSCLNMTLSPAGLFMVPARIFRLFMPPLLIPWTEVRFEGFARMLFLDLACFRLGGQGPLFAVYRRTGERVRPYLSEEDRRVYGSGRRFEGSLIDRRAFVIALAGAAVGLVAALVARKR